MTDTVIDEMADLIRGKIDGFLLKPNPNSLIVISQNLNADIRGETKEQNLLPLTQKHIDEIEGKEPLIAIKEGFEKRVCC